MPSSPDAVAVKVLFFAGAREAAGTDSASIAVASGTGLGPLLHEHILPAYPGLAPLLPGCALAVNLEYVTRGADGKLPDGPDLCAGDEVAIIPPISGG